MKKVLILGSTGSIGVSTLDVINFHKDKFQVVGLTARRNIRLLKKQVNKFHVPCVCLTEVKKTDIRFNNTKVFTGEEGLLQIIEETKPDILVNAIVGIGGLKPLFFAIEQKIENIAIANKESIVVAGKILMDKVKKEKVNLIPVDSEHSAIWQCIKNEDVKSIEKIVITATGGPLFGKKVNKKSLDIIISHPVWKMGKKISVDSATMVNKGFECIEAHYLFNIPYEKIDILIHPQAMIHSFVQFIDGNILACLFSPDMRIPISYALGCGKERIENIVKKLDLLMLNKAKFYKVNLKKFILLKLLLDCAKTDQSYLVVFNAANEVLVNKFIKQEICFDKIYEVLKKIIKSHKPVEIKSLEHILDIDRETRKKVEYYI